MIVDEKGRLFGKINIIDFLAILLLFFLIPMFYFGYKILSTKKFKPVELEKEIIDIELPCTLIKLPPETLKLIALGNKEVDKQGNQIAEISWLGESKIYQYRFYLYPENPRDFVMKDAEGLYEIVVKFKFKLEVKDDNLYYKDKRIMFNSPFEFKTDKYKVIAMPIMAATKPKKGQWLKVKVRLTDLPPELASIINEGHTEKDSEGKIVGKLDKILDRKPSEIRALKLEKNKLILIKDPYRSDITVLLNLLCTDINEEFYFKNYSIKIGTQINFTTDLYLISGSIIGIEK